MQEFKLKPGDVIEVGYYKPIQLVVIFVDLENRAITFNGVQWVVTENGGSEQVLTVECWDLGSIHKVWRDEELVYEK